VEYQKGRRLFDEESHAKYDTLGKNFGYDLINHYLNDYPHLEIISSKYLEDKKCGDLIIQNRNTEKIMKIEFECRNSFAFNQNFNAKFPTVDIPMKKLEQIKNGWYIAFDQDEIYNNNLPQRYYFIRVKDILNKDLVQTYFKRVNCHNKLEEFYAVPNYLVNRMLFNQLQGDYNEFKPYNHRPSSGISKEYYG
jgi:hypothetical protein